MRPRGSSRQPAAVLKFGQVSAINPLASASVWPAMAAKVTAASAASETIHKLERDHRQCRRNMAIGAGERTNVTVVISIVSHTDENVKPSFDG